MKMSVQAQSRDAWDKIPKDNGISFLGKDIGKEHHQMSVLSMRGGANAWPAAARIRRFVVSRAERRRRSFMQVRGWISGKRPYGNKSI